MKHLITAAALSVALASGALAEGLTHHVAIHVNENDPQVMNIALNNAQNVANYYASKGDEVVIEMVAYGPGLNMFIPGKSPVEDRISAMSLELENLSFSACGNTLAAMQKKAGHDIVLMSEATVTPSGVVRLIELQEQGYAYVKP
ncbi:MAG: DsrE family protein [Marivita sp.]|uniref:DsrE family protein n=1 Tax=Marivita sp. TaxID=2003365 RepID=UPI001B0A084D|nr:DsrE family protein [Marivita sp.]MBO6884504.1 DsrE family protein [Marivita sp.]